MNEFEKNCYGMSTEDIQNQYMNSLTANLSGLEMVVAGILSDCQEELYMSNPRVHRQLNVAKYILFQMMEKETIE
jgi:hypothetical protein